MDKIYPFPTSSASTTTKATPSTSSVGGSKSDGSDYLRHLNKLSHKITKPPLKKPPLDPPPPLDDPHPPPPHQHQPPVYNINKNDFRDVVQKLTGSPAHDRLQPPFSQPPPPAVPPPKLPSSRLHRIRPPPLSHLNPRPPTLLNCAPSAPLLDPASVASLNPTPTPPSFPIISISPSDGPPPSYPLSRHCRPPMAPSNPPSPLTCAASTPAQSRPSTPRAILSWVSVPRFLHAGVI